MLVEFLKMTSTELPRLLVVSFKPPPTVSPRMSLVNAVSLKKFNLDQRDTTSSLSAQPPNHAPLSLEEVLTNTSMKLKDLSMMLS